MVHRDAALGHHRFEVAVADRIPAVPAHCPEHNLPPEVTSLEVAHASTPLHIPRTVQQPGELCNRAPQPPQAFELGPDGRPPQEISPAASNDHALMAKHPERTCQVRNRVRQSRTLGSVGGGARQRPLLPGQGAVRDGRPGRNQPHYRRAPRTVRPLRCQGDRRARSDRGGAGDRQRRGRRDRRPAARGSDDARAHAPRAQRPAYPPLRPALHAFRQCAHTRFNKAAIWQSPNRRTGGTG